MSDHRSARKAATIGTLLFLLLAHQAAAQGPDTGRALAGRWCASCHIVDPGARSGAADGVPSFPAIAARPATTAASLDGYLSTSHTQMPDFSLGRYERDALAGYILSLRR